MVYFFEPPYFRIFEILNICWCQKVRWFGNDRVHDGTIGRSVQSFCHCARSGLHMVAEETELLLQMSYHCAACLRRSCVTRDVTSFVFKEYVCVRKNENKQNNKRVDFNNLPSHPELIARNPEWQIHLWLPGMFLHVECFLHPPLFSAHSFISMQCTQYIYQFRKNSRLTKR